MRKFGPGFAASGVRCGALWHIEPFDMKPIPRALKHGKPYDRFVKEQLANDPGLVVAPALVIC